MELILWRHALAEEHNPALVDLDRQLTAKGKTQAQRMAQWLKQRMPADTRIISSPAARACQTADALHLPYDIIEAIAPPASATSLLHACQWPHGPAVLLIGHQPALGALASLILVGRELPWSIKKGMVWWISSDKNMPALRTVLAPRDV